MLGVALDGTQGAAIADSATRNNALSKKDKEEYDERKAAGEDEEKLNEEFYNRSIDNEESGNLLEGTYYTVDKDGNWIEYEVKPFTREDTHTILDVIGMLPVIGEGADGINAGLYFMEGEYDEALLSGMGMVPVIGNFVIGGKSVNKVYKIVDETKLVKYGEIAKSVENVSSKELTSLYRAVSPEEFYDIMKSGEFSIISGKTEVKYFGLSFEEPLNFADKMSDASAIIEVKIPSDMLKKLADNTNVDTFIFKSGTVIIPADRLAEFNKVIQELAHRY